MRMEKKVLDHVSLGVSDLDRSRRFYDAVLGPLGIVRLADFEQRGSDYGVGIAPFGVEFTITRESNVGPTQGAHLCFKAKDRQAVIEFYAAALNAGGHCDGEPGIRSTYHADYFAAFVLDPDGHRIEAVCHAAGSTERFEPVTKRFKDRQVTVRKGSKIDADIIADFARAFHAEDGHPLSEKGVAALLSMLEPGFDEGMVLLLDVDGMTAGYGVLSFGYGIEHGGPETFIEDLYVVPEKRSSGLGDILINELEHRARESGCKAIHLEVMPGNRAEQWYRRLGWNDRGSKLLTKPI